MTKEEFNFIKDSFSQIIDDIAGNSDWGKASEAVASDLGTLERVLKKKVVTRPSNLDEAANDGWALYEYRESPKGLYSTCYIDGFKAGAEWMAGQGETLNGEIITTSDYGWETIRIPKKLYSVGTEVIIQIRKK